MVEKVVGDKGLVDKEVPIRKSGIASKRWHSYRAGTLLADSTPF